MDNFATIQQREIETRNGFDFVWFTYFNVADNEEIVSILLSVSQIDVNIATRVRMIHMSFNTIEIN